VVARAAKTYRIMLTRPMTAYHDRMPNPSRDTDERDRLTYTSATEEQIAEARASARQKLAEARSKHTPDYWAALRKRLGLPSRAA
jgi:hypothetical protein